jgi:hypothetical protein
MRTVKATRTPAELTRAVSRAIQALDALQQELGITAPTLSSAMKRHTARYRKGGHKVISTIGSVASQQRVDFPGSPVSEMRDQLAIADAIDALATRVEKLKLYLDNFVFSARADAWQTAMQYYALLRRMARTNGEIAVALEPVTKFMSMHDPRGKRQVGEPTRPQVRAVKRATKVLEGHPATAALLAPKTKK